MWKCKNTVRHSMLSVVLYLKLDFYVVEISQTDPVICFLNCLFPFEYIHSWKNGLFLSSIHIGDIVCIWNFIIVTIIIIFAITKCVYVIIIKQIKNLKSCCIKNVTNICSLNHKHRFQLIEKTGIAHLRLKQDSKMTGNV